MRPLKKKMRKNTDSVLPRVGRASVTGANVNKGETLAPG